MKRGDYVFVVKKEVMTGDLRPSLARILILAGGKALVESAYRLTRLGPYDEPHFRWIVPIGSCIHVSEATLQNAAEATPPDGDFSKSELVTWVDNSNAICSGIIVNVTPKTVEILENGTTKLKRKKKDLVIRS